ncbi:MAG: dioxygenase [Gammaproteobacteria bacterium]|nr:dioxygenase [Gammaproteobacteria bacterium]
MIEDKRSPFQNKMPVIFVGHGSPMNLARENRWSRGFAQLGELIPRPAAILAISAHRYTRGSYLTIDRQPPTIHDFGGFPPEPYTLEYPAPGHPDLAESVRQTRSSSTWVANVTEGSATTRSAPLPSSNSWPLIPVNGLPYHAATGAASMPHRAISKKVDGEQLSATILPRSYRPFSV